jgi:hypothetical protein
MASSRAVSPRLLTGLVFVITHERPKIVRDNGRVSIIGLEEAE